MEMPSDTKGLSGLHITPPERDDAQDIVRAILTLIRLWGRLTNRAPEAEGIAISVLQATERR